tara:strand:+ start:192 stop:503 length:312 start_codon:yes stop_codon:yes gene_type:complete
MATTTWALANVDYDVSDGFCHTAHWTVTRTDGTDPVYSASSYGAVGLTKPDSLTTRTDLKTADIIADVKAVLGTTQVDAILSGLTLKISEEKTPTQGSFVPAS